MTIKLTFCECQQAGYEADIAKYKGQEAGMGHSGWIQSWANSMRQAGLPVEGLAKLSSAKMQVKPRRFVSVRELVFSISVFVRERGQGVFILTATNC